jgi:hypothetical protein
MSHTKSFDTPTSYFECSAMRLHNRGTGAGCTDGGEWRPSLDSWAGGSRSSSRRLNDYELGLVRVYDRLGALRFSFVTWSTEQVMGDTLYWLFSWSFLQDGIFVKETRIGLQSATPCIDRFPLNEKTLRTSPSLFLGFARIERDTDSSVQVLHLGRPTLYRSWL